MHNSGRDISYRQTASCQKGGGEGVAGGQRGFGEDKLFHTRSELWMWHFSCVVFLKILNIVNIAPGGGKTRNQTNKEDCQSSMGQTPRQTSCSLAVFETAPLV